MKLDKKKWIRFRIYLVSLFFICGLSAILFRAYQLQVIQQDYLRGIAENGIIGNTKLPPKRGVIYDREGHELAVSVQVASVFAHPRQVKEKGKTARQLGRILEEKPGKIAKLLNRKRSFVWVKRRIPPSLRERIQNLGIKGIGFTTETRRYYPGRETAAHVIGFAGADNQGLEGLEKKYDRLLRGPKENLAFMRDALGRPFAVATPTASRKKMHHIFLTIDKDIQYKAQESLRAAVGKSKAKSGNCVVMDPETGEILAMAVEPEFNPNVFFNHRPHEWRNRIVTDCFEPGSTIKAFLLSAALEESVATPETEIYCEQGKYRIGGRTIHDTHKHGKLTAADIVIYSSNIGAVKLGAKVGYERFSRYLKKFGFGHETNVDLLGERSGFIRSARKARKIDQATLYFGQGMTCTSLQVTAAMAAIANGGKLMKPFVVQKIVDENGHCIEKTSPKVVSRPISPSTAATVATILRGVTSEKGTAHKAAIDGFNVAGKTGTSQKVDPKTKQYSRKKYVATFVGFVPAENPRIVILVMIDEPKGPIYGGFVAAPVFKEVGEWALNHLRVNPRPSLFANSEKETAAQDLKKDADQKALLAQEPNEKEASFSRKGQLPDFEGLGMREVLRRSHSLGLKVCLEGSGLAFKQSPAPGVPIGSTKSVKVNFRPPM